MITNLAATSLSLSLSLSLWELQGCGTLIKMASTIIGACQSVCLSIVWLIQLRDKRERSEPQSPASIHTANQTPQRQRGNEGREAGHPLRPRPEGQWLWGKVCRGRVSLHRCDSYVWECCHTCWPCGVIGVLVSVCVCVCVSVCIQVCWLV